MALGIAPLVLIAGGVYVLSPGIREKLAHMMMGVEVINSTGADFVAYRFVKKGEWHDRTVTMSTGSFHEDGAWLYFKPHVAMAHGKQISSEADLLKVSYALVETEDGEKIPAEFQNGLSDLGIAKVKLPQLPPSVEKVHVSLFDQGKLLSKVQVSKLPPMHWITRPDAVPNITYQKGDIKVTGSAHLEDPKSASGWNWLVHRIRIEGVSSNDHWRFSDFRLKQNYKHPGAPRLTDSSTSFELMKRNTFATAVWKPFNRHIKKIELEGSLGRFETHEEIVDFGSVAVINDSNKKFKEDYRRFYLGLTKPITKTLSDSTQLTLTPQLNSKDQKSFWARSTLHLRLNATPDSKVRDDGSFEVEYKLLGTSNQYYSRLFPMTATLPSETDLRFIDWDSEAKSVDLKFKVRTLKRLENHPISLVVPVDPKSKGEVLRKRKPFSEFESTSAFIN